jgi:hypothetical protein
MTASTPAFACTLEGPELMARIQSWQRVVNRATSRRIEGSRLIATYPLDARLLEELRDLIAAERTCCSFLEFTVEEGPDGVVTELRLPEEMPAPMKSLILGLMGDDASSAAHERSGSVQVR